MFVIFFPAVVVKAFHYRQVVSTNAIALEIASSDPGLHGAVVRADTQTGGRGQHGRVFASPPGGLYCSIILRPRLDLERLAMVTLAAGVGCCAAVEEETGFSPRLKWPNDLYLADRKLAGILTETGPVALPGGDPAVVVGIGMNVNTPSGRMPGDLRGCTVSLGELAGRCLDLDLLLESVVRQVMAATELLARDPAALLARWRQRDFLVSRRIESLPPAPRLQGVALGIADDGRYRIRTDDGREHLILAGSLRPAAATASPQDG